MSKEKTMDELVAAISDMSMDEVKKALPLDEPKFGRWPNRRKRTQFTQEDGYKKTREVA
jgi:hypothetical protein